MFFSQFFLMIEGFGAGSGLILKGPDPDPGGPKTYVSSATLTVNNIR